MRSACSTSPAVHLFRAMLALVLFLVLYAWLMRLGDDLSWDEAFNYRVYARHPVIAACYYREPNNHVAESLFKSFFAWGFGFARPGPLKLPALAVLAGYLAVAAAWWRMLRARGLILAPVVAGALAMTSHAAVMQAMVMRGYFPSMMVASALLLRVAARSGWLDPGADERSGRLPTRREAWGDAALCALLLWTVPSNMMMMPALVVAASWSGDPGALPRRVAVMTLRTGLITAALYAPVAAGFLAGINEVNHVPSAVPPDRMVTAFGEALSLARLAMPEGHAWWAFILGGLVLAARRMKAPAARPAFVIALLVIAPVALAGVATTSPERIKSPLAVPLGVAAVLSVVAVEGWMPERLRRRAAFVVALGALAAAAGIASRVRVEREASDLAAFLETYFEGRTRSVMICQASQPLYFPLMRAFGPDLIMSSPGGIDAAFKGPEFRGGASRNPVARAVRSLILPPLPPGVAREEDVRALVIVRDDRGDAPPRPEWNHPLLARIQERLPRESVFHRGVFTVMIREP